MFTVPTIINGGSHIDHRGTIAFFNQWDMASVRRMYFIHLPDNQIVRAWQGHRYESKFFYVSEGEILLGAIKIDNWESPSKHLAVEKFVLSSQNQQIFAIPPCYANGFKALSGEATVFVFSDKTLDESKKDDFRYPSDYWELTISK